MRPLPPRSTLFPYTTLFRSRRRIPGLNPQRADIIVAGAAVVSRLARRFEDRKSTRLNSSHSSISYAVFCLKKKNSIFIFCTACNEQNETSLQNDSTNSETSFSGESTSKESISMGGNIVCSYYYFVNETATTEIYTLSLHDALPISAADSRPESPAGRHHRGRRGGGVASGATLRRSEEHTSELQSQFHLVCRLLLEKKKLYIYFLHRL